MHRRRSNEQLKECVLIVPSCFGRRYAVVNFGLRFVAMLLMTSGDFWQGDYATNLANESSTAVPLARYETCPSPLVNVGGSECSQRALELMRGKFFHSKDTRHTMAIWQRDTECKFQISIANTGKHNAQNAKHNWSEWGQLISFSYQLISFSYQSCPH